MARKYYIPITRSLSSIIASILTQTLDNNRKIRKMEVQRRGQSGELTPGQVFFCRHPIFCIWAILVGIVVLVGMLKSIF